MAGLQFQRISSILPLARLAAVIETGPMVREKLATWLPEGADTSAHDSGLDAQPGIDALALDGFALGPHGRPVLSQEPVSHDPARPRAPLRHTLSALLRASSQSRFSRIFEGADLRSKARLYSASGPSAGKSFVASLSMDGIGYSDAQWRAALQWRLGIEERPAPGSRCQFARSGTSDEGCCGTLLGAHADHEVICPTGPLVVARHGEICELVGGFHAETGAVVRREALVPEFHKNSVDAFLDVWAFGVPEISDLLLDVTVRHPGAVSYVERAAQTPGFCCAEASRDKHNRYPPTGGRHAVCFAVETWGRLGPEAEAVLVHAAGVAAHRDSLHSRSASGRLQRWRSQLDAALHRAVANAILYGHAGLPGRSLHRSRE